MTTQPTNTLMINIKMNLRMNRTHIQGIFEYVRNTGNTEPGRAIKTYPGEI